MSGKQPPKRIVMVEDVPVCVVHRAGMTTVRVRVDDAGECIVSAHPLVPEEEMLACVRKNLTWVREQQRKRQDSPSYRAAHATKAEQAQWESVMAKCVPYLVAEWEGILGVKAGKIVYRNMSSKWGSCQPETGRICINTRLALYPPECLEYVVVHELCHLLEPNHGRGFRMLMDRIMPDWKQRRDKLRN